MKGPIIRTEIGSPRQIEKRHLAVMFIDVVGSTQLGIELGAEQANDLLSRVLRDAESAIDVNGGFVARYMGDGLLAYFGYPMAAEDDSVRAVRSALSIVSAVQALGEKAQMPLAVRCGIATGPIVLDDWLGQGGARERPIVGEAANLAARLQSAADPNTILVSELTYQLAQQAIGFRERSGLSLKGFEHVTHGYEAIETLTWEHRPWLDVANHDLMIGRDEELNRLRLDFMACRKGFPTVISILGEAGIGKSTLVRAFLKSISGRAHRLIWASASPSRSNEPYFCAKQMFAIDPFSSDRVESASARNTIASNAALQLTAEDKVGTKIIVVEDVHWADPSSMEFLTKLSATEADQPVFIIHTSREAPLAAPSGKGNARTLTLAPLNDGDVEQLVHSAGGARVSSQMISEIIKRASGIPLFAVELARHSVENGATNALPWTLTELVSARCSALGSALDLANSLAVLGHSSSSALLSELARVSRHDIREQVGLLLDSGLIRIDGDESDPHVAFSHALVREAIYASLLTGQREALHRRAAELAEASAEHGVPADDQAHHWLMAGVPMKAAIAFASAGRQYHENYAFREAEQAFEQGLIALKSSGASTERETIELSLQTDLATVLQINHGYSNPRAKSAANRARAIADRRGALSQQFANLARVWMAASSAGDYIEAEAVARRLDNIASRVGNLEVTATASMAQLTSRFRLGDLVGAENAFLFGRDSFSAPSFAARPGAIAQTYGNAALVAVLLNDPIEARRRAALAIKHSRRIMSQFDLCFATYMAAMLALMLGADDMAMRLSGRALYIAKEMQFPQFIAIAQVVHGRARATMVDAESGVAMIRNGIGAMESTYSKVGLSLYYTWLAEAECAARNIESALVTLEKALSINSEELFFRPEAMRLKARLLSAIGRHEDAAILTNEARQLAQTMASPWFIARMDF